MTKVSGVALALRSLLLPFSLASFAALAGACNVDVGGVDAKGTINEGDKNIFNGDAGAPDGGADQAMVNKGGSAGATPGSGTNISTPPRTGSGGSGSGSGTPPPPPSGHPINPPPPPPPNDNCGDVGQTCCPDPSGPTCTASGSVCSMNKAMCVACGGVGEPCCTGDACGSGGVCGGSGKCVACGALLQPCCGDTCDDTLSCISSMCDVTCTLPEVANGGSCVVPAPRQVAPLSGSNLTTRLPTLSWVLPASVTDAHVQVCQDRACSTVIEESDVAGATYTVANALPMGNVYWRVTSIVSGSTTKDSPVWELRVAGPHDAAVFSAWGAAPDFNGDGYSDIVMQTSSDTRVYNGTASGLSASAKTLSTGFGGLPQNGFLVGDVNGDGYIDLILASGNIAVFRGSANGLPTAASQTINNTTPSIQSENGFGDVNGDGFGDVVFTSTKDDGNGNNLVVVQILLGSAGGLAINPVSIETDIVHQGGSLEVFDVDGDGYADVVSASITGLGGGSTGTVAVFAGGADGVSSTHQDISIANASFGLAVSCAGDVNGDGYVDLLVFNQSSAYLYEGGSSGLANSSSATLTGVLPIASGPSRSASFGLGDVNGDGYADVVAAINQQAQVRVFFGSSTGLSSGSSQLLTAPTPPSFTPSMAYVQALSTIGDVNGDGYADLAFSVEWTNASNVKNHQVYMWSGASSVPSTPSTTLPLTVQLIR